MFTINRQNNLIYKILHDACKYNTRNYKDYLTVYNYNDADYFDYDASTFIYGNVKANSFAHAEMIINYEFCVEE